MVEGVPVKSLDIVGFGLTVPVFKRKAWTKAKTVWTINNAHASYDLHTDRIVAMDDLERDIVEYPKYVDEITKAGVPVVTSTAYPQWPTTQAYPLGDAIDLIGDTRLAQRVLTNSWCYALVLAMLEGYEEIGLYGAEFEQFDPPPDIEEARANLKPHQPSWFIYYDRLLMRTPTEPGIHGLTFLMGMAVERGIGIRIPAGSTLLDWDRPGFFYGYQEQPCL